MYKEKQDRIKEKFNLFRNQIHHSVEKKLVGYLYTLWKLRNNVLLNQIT